jgi:translation elongation factor EF-Ts
VGFGDKFKDLAKQAQDAVAEHKDQIHEAVEAVSVAADEKTKGKYSDKIAKFGQKAGDVVDKVAPAPDID